MIFDETPLKGSYVISPVRVEDSRGFFMRIFCHTEFQKRNLEYRWVQSNNSYTKRAGTLRGLHFQGSPYAEVKLVRCISGTIWDVIVDLRNQSPTFGKWFSVELSEENKKMIYVPQGFAHGFISLKDHAEIMYLVSEAYNPEFENTLLWCDKDVQIDWPFQPKLVSEKDSRGKCLSNLSPVEVARDQICTSLE